jgi:mRNA interferase RelE/StbE
MNYTVEFKPKAQKDLADLTPAVRQRILPKIERLQDNLAGDVKRLTNFTPEFRLRVGDYRVLFEVEEQRVIIYRIRHRKEAYG